MFLKPSILQQPEINLFQPSNSALLHQYENLLDGEQKTRCWTVKDAGRVLEGQGQACASALPLSHHISHWPASFIT
jgi:hypothetical protein